MNFQNVLYLLLTICFTFSAEEIKVINIVIADINFGKNVYTFVNLTFNSVIFNIGTSPLPIIAKISLNQNGIVVFDKSCGKLNERCPNYCNDSKTDFINLIFILAEFCDAFCHPICCFEEGDINERCKEIDNQMYFDRNSKTLEILDGYWWRYKEYRLYAGEYLNDYVSISLRPIGRSNIFSITLPTGISGELGTLGFAKESFGQSIPEVLYEQNEISSPIITFVANSTAEVRKAYIVLGMYVLLLFMLI